MHEQLSALEGVILGLLQGLTEFLPVSSSGHLAAYGVVFGERPLSLSLVVLLHVATLLATVLVFAPDLKGLVQGTFRGLTSPARFLQTDEGRLLLNLVLASLPTAAIGLGLKSSAGWVATQGWAIGVTLLTTAAVLLTTRSRAGSARHLSTGQALLVGVVQGIAVLPGLSRSGLTIACALALGMEAHAAFRFSFLLSIPAIVGATLLELGDMSGGGSPSPGVWIAAAVTFASGLASLLLLRRLVVGGRFWLFAVYLLPLGALMILRDLLHG